MEPAAPALPLAAAPGWAETSAQPARARVAVRPAAATAAHFFDGIDSMVMGVLQVSVD